MNPRLLLLLACTIFVGCNTEKIAKLEKQNQELRAAVAKDRAQTYELQSKCSSDARQWFNRAWPPDKNTILLNETNHYNANENKCFIIVEWHYRIPSADGSWVGDTMLYDVQENNQLGSLSTQHDESLKPEFQVNEVESCRFLGEKCTKEQFIEEVAKRMND